MQEGEESFEELPDAVTQICIVGCFAPRTCTVRWKSLLEHKNIQSN